MKTLVFALILISTMGTPLAFAHPFLLESNPLASSNVPEGTSQVLIHFSEAVDLDFSDIKVIDSNGNQIDNRDTKYFDGDKSLVVTTPPLSSGVYTVTTKVLSKVDGHLVPYAFVFAVGDVKIEAHQLETLKSSDIVFLPEAGARFPGFVGQTIVLGAIISSILIWGTQKKDLIKNELEKFQSVYHGKLMFITGLALVLVFASNILSLGVQSFRLETSALNALQTTFGSTWIFRMIITLILLGVWFWMERSKILTLKRQIPMLLLSLVLIGTSTMVGHGFASEQSSAIVLDYIHNLVAAIWIGGIIFFALTLLPSFGSLSNDIKEKISLVLIPRFSIVFVISVGIIIISGPMLMWFLESDVGTITESTYGKLIFVKIGIAAAMIAVGGFFQFKVQKDAENDYKSGKLYVHKKLQRSLKVDVVLGVLLLGVVSLLVNGTLPAGEIQKVDAQITNYGFSTMEFSENAKFGIEILPSTVGANLIIITAYDLDNNPLADLAGLKVKVSNPSKNITPFEIPIERLENENRFKGDITFGFSGDWRIEIEAQRTQDSNELVILNIFVKPRLIDLQTQITEYDLPETANPLFPIYDEKGNIWISDTSAPRIWKFAIEDKSFEKYEFDGETSITLEVDRDGKIWFTDIPKGQIGYLEPQTGKITIISLPSIVPLDRNPVPMSLKADFENNIWITVLNKNVILKYDQISGQFEKFTLPTKDSGPFALALDSSGNVWFSESVVGKIGVINTKTKEIKEFSPRIPLASPEALNFDKVGNLWIAEHTGLGITKFNPELGTFEKKSVPDKNALPFGMVFDKYGNVWFAQHTVDKIGVYDPDNDELIEIPVPTTNSFVQFTTTDNENNIWFIEQQGNKLGVISLTEIPSMVSPVQKTELKIKYVEIVAPLMAIGIIATSLFFVKNIHDKRRINALIIS